MTSLFASVKAKDEALDRASKALFDQQMGLIRDGAGRDTAREAAILEFMRMRLTPGPSVQPSSQAGQ
jgi:hypothetical protein